VTPDIFNVMKIQVVVFWVMALRSDVVGQRLGYRYWFTSPVNSFPI